MTGGTWLTLTEQVRISPAAFAIAKVLAGTELADADGPCDDSDHWKDPYVIDTTLEIIDALREAGIPL